MRAYFSKDLIGSVYSCHELIIIRGLHLHGIHIHERRVIFSSRGHRVQPSCSYAASRQAPIANTVA